MQRGSPVRYLVLAGATVLAATLAPTRAPSSESTAARLRRRRMPPALSADVESIDAIVEALYAASPAAPGPVA